ncbi:MAG: VapC toxin family PIN domain ribonuclease, partial [Actinomycetota bacterium]|nr:VapC toxin family PIN domain ribonuclease [Actinomycetota bacterium]
MPTSVDAGPELLVDTSVAVALSVADHEGRAACRAGVEGRRIGLAGHAAFETFSVLTRLPGPARRSVTAVSR